MRVTYDGVMRSEETVAGKNTGVGHHMLVDDPSGEISAMPKRSASDAIRQKTLVFWLAFAGLLWFAHSAMLVLLSIAEGRSG